MSAAHGEAALPPGSWLGVLGGGQLGRMFCMAAQSMGYRVCVLDPAADAPAGAVAEQHIIAAYEDAAALDELGARCAAVTTEFENIPAASLQRLARRCRVRPAADAVAVAQDRIAEKRFFRSCGVEVVEHAAVRSDTDVTTLDPALVPGILKTARLGYDGKGQVDVAERSSLIAAWQQLRSVECVLEQRVALRRELSVIVARGTDGAKAYFAPIENEHRGGILAVSTIPAPLEPAQAERARSIAARIADALQYVGVLCVELFELADGRLLVNEIAPRPHNSGHATIEACASSQFVQQVRTLSAMPLGDPTLLAPAVMLNLLGELWIAGGASHAPAFEQVLAIPGACLHLYGKAEARAGRKMGHVTVLGGTLQQAHERACRVAEVLHLQKPKPLALGAVQPALQ